MKFDSKTLLRWKENNITTISCFTSEKGCAGRSVTIIEGKEKGMDQELSIPPLSIWINKNEEFLFSDAFISWNGKKWILKSENINTRCGCGSSFSVKSGNELHDKIARTKLALKQKKEGIHK